MDDSVLCSDAEHRKFQMLMGMLNWVVTIGMIGCCSRNHVAIKICGMSA
jgi:hypothetical protein